MTSSKTPQVQAQPTPEQPSKPVRRSYWATRADLERLGLGGSSDLIISPVPNPAGAGMTREQSNNSGPPPKSSTNPLLEMSQRLDAALRASGLTVSDLTPRTATNQYEVTFVPQRATNSLSETEKEAERQRREREIFASMAKALPPSSRVL